MGDVEVLQGTALQRLQAAVVKVAAETPIGAVSVAALCREAGVTRDTFYRLAVSPAQVLAAVFDEDLSPLGDLAGQAGDRDDYAAVMEDTTSLWLAHVQRYEAVYRKAATPHLVPELSDVLHRRIERVLIEYMRQHPEIVPRLPPGPGDGSELGMLARYAVSGGIGVLEMALQHSDRLDSDRIHDVIHAAAAGWWFGPGGTNPAVEPCPPRAIR